MFSRPTLFPLRRFAAYAVGCATLLSAGSLVAASLYEDRLILEAMDLTAAGRKVPPPTPSSPTYYFPVYRGYRELGGVEKFYQRKPADDEEIERQLTTALKQQGYLLSSKAFPATMVLVFEWGSISPLKIGDRGGDGGQVLNYAEVRAYVLGAARRNLDPHSTYYYEMTSLEARHFLLISAFDVAAALQNKEVLLWRAHVTTDLWGNYLEEVLKPMIAHAAPILGKAMKPGVAWSSAIPNVTIGEAKVVEPKTPEPVRK